MLEEKLDSLVALAYGATLDDRKWDLFLRSCDEFLGGGIRTCLFGYDLDSGLHLGVRQHGYDPAYQRSYADHHAGQDFLAARMLEEGAGRILPYSAVWSDSARRRTEFYNDWVKPQEDITGGCSILLFRDESRLFTFSGSIRARDAERLEPSWQRLVTTIAPHLRQAFEIARTLAVADLEKQALVNVGNPATAACLAIARTGRIVFANAQAERMLEDGTDIRRDFRHRLAFARARWERRFAAALRRCAAASPPETLTLDLRDGADILPLTCRIAPMAAGMLDRRPAGLLFDSEETRFLITLSRPPEDGDLGIRLRRRFGLTRNEAEVVRQVASGLSARKISEDRAISVHTVRNQIQSAMGKMQVHRQLDMVRLVEALRR